MARILGPLSAVAAAAVAWYGAFRPQPPPATEYRWLGHRHSDEFYQKRPFNTSELPDLTGRVALITGGSSGVGLEVARSLYAEGCTVVITSRSQERAEKAASKLIEEVGFSSGRLEGMGLELDDLEDVRRFAKEFSSRYEQLNYLCENAGQGPLLSQAGYEGPLLSKQGYETQYAANYLGHFLLFQELLPTLLRLHPADSLRDFRSSISQWIHDPNLHNLLPSSQVMMCFEAQRRLTEGGKANSLTVTPVTPGLVNTAVINFKKRDGSGDHNPMAKSAADGAVTTLYALLSAENDGAVGAFIQPYWTPKHRSAPLLQGIDVNLGFEFFGQRFSWGVHRWLAHPDAYAEAFIKELWDESMRATGATPVI